VLVLGVGAGAAFVLDAVSFLISAWMALGVRPRERGAPAQAGTVAEQLRGGWREVRSRTWVWVNISAFTVAVLAGFSTWNALAPVIARHHYGTVSVFGVVETASGVGAVIGALIALHWRPRRPLLIGMLLGLVWPLQGVAIALGAPEVTLAAFGVGGGFGFALLMIWWETALAQHIPPAALGRVSSWDWMGALGLMPLGYLIAGPVGSAIGDQLTLGVGSVIALAALILGTLPRSVRDLEFVTDTDLAVPAAVELPID
jgi:MFS family permease